MSSTTEPEIAIIGAGLSGLGMAIALRRAGIDDFVLLERGGDVGGTWRDNTYPGVAVDVPAQAYQFSYELNPEWTRAFAPGREVKAYIDHLVDAYDLRRHVRLDTEVRQRDWDAARALWRLTLRDDATIHPRFVISAIGAFVDPKAVDIPGLEDFAGEVLHSARWDHDIDLCGKRIAVIGTGASAVQIVPELAAQARHLDVYQRTPIWVGPKIDPPTPPWLRAVYRRAPRVQQVVQRAATRGTEFLLIDLVVQRPSWANQVARFLRTVWYRTQVGDADLRARLTPDYGFGCKRPSVSSSYLRTFTRPHVSLVTDPIECIKADGIRTVDGVDHAADALVLATGFRMASDPATFVRTPVHGRDGFDLATRYATERLASYEGVSLPGLPNHFMLFGPYGWTGGTWHQLVETASTHIVRVIGEAHRRGATVVEVRPEACQRWTEEMRRRMATSLFQTSNCDTARSYYFDHHGDTPYLRPTSAAQAMRSAHTFPLTDYEFQETA
jgi:cation diffusion facilitator CzcD-associated flavoprotein CzcO